MDIILLEQHTDPDEADGGFNAMAVRGMIFGIEMVPIVQQEISELQARKLLVSTAEQAGGRPASLYVAAEERATQISVAAKTMNIDIKRVPEREFAEITKEARGSFAKYVARGGER